MPISTLRKDDYSNLGMIYRAASLTQLQGLSFAVSHMLMPRHNLCTGYTWLYTGLTVD